MASHRLSWLAVALLSCGGDDGSGAGTNPASSTGADGTAGEVTTIAAATETATGVSTATTDDPDSTGTGAAPTGPIGVLTVTFATASADEMQVNATPLSLCLTQDDCFELVRPHRADAGKREAGPLQFDVHAFEDVALTVEDVDRFELRSQEDAPFVPECLSVSFDGAPALCSKAFDGPLASTTTWAADASSDCTSCFVRGDDVDLQVTHGPFVGGRDAAAGTATVWVRTDASRAVALWISADPAMDDARLADTVVPEANDDFTAELSVDGLAAGGTYYYRLDVDGAPHVPVEEDVWHPGGVYTLQMPPPEGAATEFTFAFGSCARMFAHGNYDAVRDASPAFLLSVGDYHYGNVLQVHFADEGASLDERLARDEMRWWYRTAQWEKSTLLATVPLLGTWDDHDYGGGETYADRDAQGRDGSRASFLEYFANPTRAQFPEDEAVHFRYTHGDVEFFVLDARWHRPRLCDVEGGGIACDPTEDPLGAAQTDWLLDGLSTSTATFKFIAAGTRFYGGGAKAWTPFLVARDALLEQIDETDVTGVVFLAGGPHVSEYRQFTAAGRVWHELIGSPLSSGLGACSGASGQIQCYDAIKNFVLVDVDTTLPDPTVTARIMTFAGEQPWSDTTDQVVLPLSILQ